MIAPNAEQGAKGSHYDDNDDDHDNDPMVARKASGSQNFH